MGTGGRRWAAAGCGRFVRPVRAADGVPVGKRSYKLEAVEAGLEHDPDEVNAEYANPGRDPWRPSVLPVLRDVPAARLADVADRHLRWIPAIRNGRRAPHPQRGAPFDPPSSSPVPPSPRFAIGPSPCHPGLRTPGSAGPYHRICRCGGRSWKLRRSAIGQARHSSTSSSSRATVVSKMTFPFSAVAVRASPCTPRSVQRDQ